MVGIFLRLSLCMRSHIANVTPLPSVLLLFMLFFFFFRSSLRSLSKTNTHKAGFFCASGMSIYERFSMGLSCGEDDFGKNESHEVPIIVDSRETRVGGGNMDLQHRHHAVEFEVEFWPVEHPKEPQEEDRPVKCPMPTSSVVKNGRAHEQRSGKRADDLPLPAVMSKQGIVVVAAEPQVRAVRKRHHTLTRQDHRVIAPDSTRMVSLPALPTPNVTIFQMLQEFDKFDQY